MRISSLLVTHRSSLYQHLRRPAPSETSLCVAPFGGSLIFSAGHERRVCRFITATTFFDAERERKAGMPSRIAMFTQLR
jgi:hypothetical protein